MSDEQPEYNKLVTLRNGLYEMLYLTDYELKLSMKRRLKDNEVYTEDELLKLLSLPKDVPVKKRTCHEVSIISLIIVCLVLILLFEWI